MSTDAPTRRQVSRRLTASPSRTEPHAAANTVADSRSGATPDSGATLSAHRISTYAPSVSQPPIAALRISARPPAKTSPPATNRTQSTSTTDVVTHRIAAYVSGWISCAPSRSTAL